MKKLALYTLTLGAMLSAPAIAFAQEQAPMAPMPTMQPMAPMPPMGQPPPPPAPGEPPPNGAPLAPPPPMDPNAQNPNPQGSTQAKLEAADKADSGRNFELIYVNGTIGASYINMTSFTSNADTASFGLKTTESAGPMFDLSAGVRLVLLTLGVRMRLNQLSAFGLWQLNAEVGLKIPIDKLDLYFMGHGGYDFLGSLDKAALSSDTDTQQTNVTVRGWNAGLDAGVDYYLAPIFSVGAGISGDFLSLTRPEATIPSGLTDAQKAAIQSNSLYQQSGQSYGFGIAGGLRLGLHFGL